MLTPEDANKFIKCDPYFTYDEDGISGVSDNAPDEIKKTYNELEATLKQAKKSDIKI